MRKELRTDLTLNGAKFDAGMKAARARLARFNREIGRPLAQGVRNLARLGAMAGVAAAGMAVLAATRAGKFGDDIAKAAKRVGMAVKDVSELSYMAELSGASFATVETGVKRMATALYDAERGLKESVDALGELGLTAQALKGKSVAEQFSIIGGRIGEMTDATRQAAIAQRLLGRGGMQLLPMLKAGTAGLEGMRKEAARLGVVLSPDQAKNAEEFQDSLTRVKKAWMGVQLAFLNSGRIAEILNGLAYKIAALAQAGYFTAIAQKVMDTGKKWGRAFLDMADKVATFGSNLFGGFGKAILVLGGFVLAVKTGLALPLIKLLAALGTTIVHLLATPWGIAFGSIAAALAGWNLGKIIEDKFDLSSYVAAGLLRLKAFGSAIAAFFKSVGPGFVEEFDDALLEIDERLRGEMAILKQARADRSNVKPPQVESVFAQWKAQLEGITLDANLAPESLQAMQANVDGLLGRIGEPIANAFRQGAPEFARLFSGKFGKQTEAQRSKEALKMVKQQEASNKRLSRLVALQERRPTLSF